MAKWDTVTDYSSAAIDFDRLRLPGPETVRRLKAIFASIPKDGCVLSLGCGTGQYEHAVFGGEGVVGLDQSEEIMANYLLTVYSLPSDSQGDVITRTYSVRAKTLAEAEYSSTVFSAIPGTMDNVIDWRAQLDDVDDGPNVVGGWR